MRIATSYILALSILAVLAYGFLIEPYRIKVQHLYIQEPNLERILGEKRVVQISDLHLPVSRALTEDVLRILGDIEPDLLLLTGDYVKWNGDYEVALDFLSKVKATYGAWAVMGDADYSRSRKSCLFCHEPGSGEPTRRHDVKFLRNSWECIPLAEGQLWIGGVDETARGDHRVNFDSFVAQKEGAAIVLSHNPLGFDDFAVDKSFLMLAGDTHGGQIPLPSWFWTVMGYDKNARYNYGLFEEGRKKMFVSRGVGTSHLPFRVFVQPEIVVFHFQQEY